MFSFDCELFVPYLHMKRVTLIAYMFAYGTKVCQQSVVKLLRSFFHGNF